MGQAKKHKILPGKPEWKRPLGRSLIKLEETLKFILNKYQMKVWNGLIWLCIMSRSRLS
jgi:hypothetical protein